MITVERSVRPSNFASSSLNAVSFKVFPKENLPDGFRVEMVSHEAQHSEIRMVDAKGSLILHEKSAFSEAIDRLEYTIRNLVAGTYFFEVYDGFFHQVKEVRIPPC